MNLSSKRLVCILLSVLFICFSFTACANSDSNLDFSNTGNEEKDLNSYFQKNGGNLDVSTNDEKEETTSNTKPNKKKKNTSKKSAVTSFVYKSLSDSQKNVYDQMKKQIDDRSRKSYSIKKTNEDDLQKGYEAFILDYPECVWLHMGYAYSSSNKKDFELTPNLYGKSINEYWSIYDDIMSSANKLVDAASQKGSDYEMALFVHDYLVDHVDYDDATLKKLEKAKYQSNAFYPATTPYGALNDEKAVCSGYSAAFQLVMKQLGIDCGRASGSKKDGGSHEWNYILLDGDYYYVDVTWDDPVSDNAKKDVSSPMHTYFCITTDELLKNRTIDKAQALPKCTATKMNYFVMSNLFLEKYDYDKVIDIIKKNDFKETYIKFGSESEAKKALKDLVDDKKIFKLKEFKDGVNYYQDDSIIFIEKD